MQLRTFLALVVSAISLTAVGIAYATAPSGITPNAHVAAARLDATNVYADGVKLQTKAPTDVSVLTLTVDPGGTTGWHTHPGFALVAVSQGTGTLTYADCSSRTFEAGDAFVEAGRDRPTLFRNETSSPVVLTVTFVAPRGAAIIRDEPAPPCGVS